MEKQLNLVVLAAGMGSRYGGLKQLEAIGPNGETLLDYSVYDALRAGYAKVVFVIRRDIESAFRAGVSSRYEGRIDIGYAFQELSDLPGAYVLPDERTKPWGTAHAVWAARDEITGPFTVINADDFYGVDAYAEMAAYATGKLDEKPVLALVTYPLERTLSEHGTVNRGICEVRDGRLISVQEVTEITPNPEGRPEGMMDGKKVDLDPQVPVSMNFWGFSPEHLPHLQSYLERFLASEGRSMKAECYIPGFVDHLIGTTNATCHVLSSTGSWFGVTYPADKPHVQAALEKEILNRRYPRRLI